MSPAVARAWARDTTLTVWLFARPQVALDTAARRAAEAGASVRARSRPSPPAVQADACPAGGDPVYGPSETPYRQLHLRPLADRGYDGTGVRIAILDAGFNTLNPAFSGVLVSAQRDFVFGDSVVRDEANDQPGAHDHGTAVWSLFAGDVPGRLRGIAPGARYLLAKTEDIRQEVRRHATSRLAPDTMRGWGRPDVTASAVFPLGVVPLEPVDSVLTSVTPTFRWRTEPIPGFAAPVTYRLRVARDSTLAVPLVDTTLAAEQYDLRLALKPGAPLFWRVDATAATGDSATTGLLGPIRVPTWATLTALSRPEGENTLDDQPTFTWTSPAIATPPGPFRYDLSVYRRSAQVPDFKVTGLTGTSFEIPQPLERNVAYNWFLAVSANPPPDTVVVRSVGTFLVLDPRAPRATVLYQNFPNPFPAPGREVTCIWFDLARVSDVELVVLDLRGNAVRQLVPGPQIPGVLSAGRYGRGADGGPTCDDRLTWDGTTDDGRTVPAGVYLYRLRAGALILFKRIVFRGRSR